MNRDDEFIAQLEDYLDTFEGVVPLPASVRSAVQARLPSTRQVRGSSGPERILEMASRLSTPARWGMGIAAVLAFVVLGAAAMNLNGSGPGVGAAQTPISSPSTEPTSPEPATAPPTTSSSGAAGPLLLPANSYASCGPGLPDGCIEAGTYRLANPGWPATIALDVPTGWWRYAPSFDSEGILVEVGDASEGSGWGITFHSVDEVSRDPCDIAAGRFAPEETASAEGLVEAMQSWPGFDVSAPTPIDVDGYAGQLVEVTSTRTATECGFGTLWTTPRGSTVDPYPMVGVAGQPRPAQYRILDVEGELVVIRTTDFGDPSPFELGQGIEPDPERHAEDQVELRAIVESIQITP